jgi:bifunctional non-homologous end joining protein LigD
VFLDYNMNVRGKSIIAPYAPRGLAGAPVSMPLTWAQLAKADPFDFRISTLHAPLIDVWSTLMESKQDLAAKLSRSDDSSK